MFGRIVVVLTLLAAACGGRTITRAADKDWLEAIVIDGNEQVEDDDLTSQIAITRALGSDWVLDPYQVQLDTRRIRATYLRYGFFDVKVTSRVDSRSEDDVTVYTVVFEIHEGPRARMNVVIAGLPPEIPMELAQAAVAIEDGTPFNYDDYDDGKEPLLALLEDAGYAHATLDAAVIAEKSRGIATAHYAVEPGVRTRFGQVTLSGAAGDLATAVINRLAFVEGDPFSRKALAATQRNLYELGRFSTVRIVPDRTAGGVEIPIHIEVAPATRHEIQLGGGFGYEPLTYEARLRAGGSLIPEHHPLWRLGADARIALTTTHDGDDYEPKLRTLFTAKRIDLFERPRLEAEVGIGFDYLATEAFTSTGPLVRLGLSSPLGVAWLQARVGWSASYSRFVDVSDFIDESNRMRFELDEDQRIGSFDQTIVADLRDDPIDPRKGAYLGLRISEANPYAASAFRYVQLAPDLRGYLPLGPIVLAMRVRAGAILGDVPVTERLFSGGAQSHRGFSERELAPRITGTVETASGPVTGSVLIGGAALLEAGAELRIPFGELAGFELGGTVFLDGGDVTANTEDLDPAHLHWAAGAGVSAKVGGIKIRIDVGHRLNRTGPGEPQYDPDAWLPNTNVHFGVGDTF